MTVTGIIVTIISFSYKPLSGVIIGTTTIVVVPIFLIVNFFETTEEGDFPGVIDIAFISKSPTLFKRISFVYICDNSVGSSELIV